MQELIIVTSCDIEYNDTLARVEAEEVTWYLHGTPWVVDLCKEHRDTVPVSQMQTLVEAYGRPLAERRGEVKPKRKRKPKGEGSASAAGVSEETGERVHCPYPECDDMGGLGYQHRGSLGVHFQKNHGDSLSVWEAKQRGDKPEIKCEASGCRAKFYNVQQRVQHMRTEH